MQRSDNGATDCEIPILLSYRMGANSTNDKLVIIPELDYSETLELLDNIKDSVAAKISEYGHSENLDLIDKFLCLLLRGINSPRHTDAQKWKIVCSVTQEYVGRSEEMFKALRYRKIAGVPELTQQKNTRILRRKFRDLFKRLLTLINQGKTLYAVEQTCPPEQINTASTNVSIS